VERLRSQGLVVRFDIERNIAITIHSRRHLKNQSQILKRELSNWIVNGRSALLKTRVKRLRDRIFISHMQASGAAVRNNYGCVEQIPRERLRVLIEKRGATTESQKPAGVGHRG